MDLGVGGLPEGGQLGRGGAEEKEEGDLAGAGGGAGGSVRAPGTGHRGRAWQPHHFVLVEDQPVVMGHEAEAVPPLLVVLLVLEEVPREDDAFVQRHLWREEGAVRPAKASEAGLRLARLAEEESEAQGGERSRRSNGDARTRTQATPHSAEPRWDPRPSWPSRHSDLRLGPTPADTATSGWVWDFLCRTATRRGDMPTGHHSAEGTCLWARPGKAPAPGQDSSQLWASVSPRGNKPLARVDPESLPSRKLMGGPH